MTEDEMLGRVEWARLAANQILYDTEQIRIRIHQCGLETSTLLLRMHVEKNSLVLPHYDVRLVAKNLAAEHGMALAYWMADKARWVAGGRQ